MEENCNVAIRGGGGGGQIGGAEKPNLHSSKRRLRGLCGGFSPICLIISNPGGGGGGGNPGVRGIP